MWCSSRTNSWTIAFLAVYVNDIHRCSCKFSFFLADDANILYADKIWKTLRQWSTMNHKTFITGWQPTTELLTVKIKLCHFSSLPKVTCIPTKTLHFVICNGTSLNQWDFSYSSLEFTSLLSQLCLLAYIETCHCCALYLSF